MGDGEPSTLCADLAATIAELFEIGLDLDTWVNGEDAASERIEPVMKAIHGAERELRVVRSLLLQLEQLPDVRSMGGRFPSLDALAEHARNCDPVMPDEILRRLQQVVITARAAGVGVSVTRAS